MTESPAAPEPRPATMAGRSAVYSPRGTIATSHPLASAAGVAVLERGGNAVDAAVTAAAVLTVVEPHMTGIGGDLFALLWSAREGRLLGLNASGRAGAGMTRDELIRRGRAEVPHRGPESITVPGALAGWDELLRSHGSIPLAEALEPAIRLAEEGFPVSPIIASQWAGRTEVLSRDPGAAAAYLPGGRAPAAGEWFRNPDYAAVLRTLAAEGPAALYGGELGRRLADGLGAMGGFVTLDDLRAHRVRWVEPVSVDFRGHRVWQLPPNGQGIAALEMLSILEPFDLAGMGHNSAEYLHLLVEAKKLAFADLARWVADPDFMEIRAEELLGDAFVRERRALIDPDRAVERAEAGTRPTASETVFLAAADASGNMISFINSIYEAFGSGVVVPGTGFALQNRAAGFTLEEGHANSVAPGKLPLHTLIPGFVTRPGEGGSEEPWLAYGVMGGSMQPQGHVQLLLNLLVFGMGIQEAIDAARFRHLDGLRLALEAPIPAAVRERLRELGHDVVDEADVVFGGAQAVMRLPRGWVAGSDPRKDGQVAGH